MWQCPSQFILLERRTCSKRLNRSSYVLAAIQEVGDVTSLHHYQHMTMARVAHDALLPGAELMKLRVADVEWSGDGKAVTLHIHLFCYSVGRK